MQKQLSFCQAHPNDWLVLQDVSRQTFYESFAHANTEADMQSYLAVNLGEDRLQVELSNPFSLFYFAKLGEHIIGYVKLNLTGAQTEINDGQSLEVERIYLLKEFQRKGFGQAMFDFALNQTRELGLSYMWLAVWEKNDGAIRFYERNGLVSFGKHSFFLGSDEQTDILMKLNVIK